MFNNLSEELLKNNFMFGRAHDMRSVLTEGFSQNELLNVVCCLMASTGVEFANSHPSFSEINGLLAMAAINENEGSETWTKYQKYIDMFDGSPFNAAIPVEKALKEYVQNSKRGTATDAMILLAALEAVREDFELSNKLLKYALLDNINGANVEAYETLWIQVAFATNFEEWLRSTDGVFLNGPSAFAEKTRDRRVTVENKDFQKTAKPSQFDLIKQIKRYPQKTLLFIVAILIVFIVLGFWRTLFLSIIVASAIYLKRLYSHGDSFPDLLNKARQNLRSFPEIVFGKKQIRSKGRHEGYKVPKTNTPKPSQHTSETEVSNSIYNNSPPIPTMETNGRHTTVGQENSKKDCEIPSKPKSIQTDEEARRNAEEDARLKAEEDKRKAEEEIHKKEAKRKEEAERGRKIQLAENEFLEVEKLEQKQYQNMSNEERAVLIMANSVKLNKEKLIGTWRNCGAFYAQGDIFGLWLDEFSYSGIDGEPQNASGGGGGKAFTYRVFLSGDESGKCMLYVGGNPNGYCCTLGEISFTQDNTHFSLRCENSRFMFERI